MGDGQHERDERVTATQIRVMDEERIRYNMFVQAYGGVPMPEHTMIRVPRENGLTRMWPESIFRQRIESYEQAMTLWFSDSERIHTDYYADMLGDEERNRLLELLHQPTFADYGFTDYEWDYAHTRGWTTI